MSEFCPNAPAMSARAFDRSTSVTRHHLRKKKSPSFNAKDTRCAKELKEVLKQPDQDTSFSLCVAGKLQGFDRQTRVIAEKKISDILFDLELEQISGDGFNYTGPPAVSNITPPH